MSLRKSRIKLTILLKQNKVPLAILSAWFLFGFSAYALMGLGIPDASSGALYLSSPHNWFSDAYEKWGTYFIFGVVLAFIFQNSLDRYNPKEGCRLLAKEMRNHTVIIGYSHMGARLVSEMIERKRPFVLVEDNDRLVQKLVERGEPVITEDPKDVHVLEEAGVKKARAVVIALDKTSDSVVITKRVRDLNRNCTLIVRYFEDDMAEVIEALGATEVVSSSKSAVKDILAKLESA